MIAPAAPLAVVRDYDGLRAALRARADQLQVTRLVLDDATGLPAGYCAKLLAPVPSKNLGCVSLGLLLGALGLKLLVVQDDEALARIKGKLVLREQPMQSAGQHGPVVIKLSRRRLRKLARLGAAARMTKMTAAARRRVARIAARARWSKAAKRALSLTRENVEIDSSRH